jgi:hypothetical protein
MNTIEQTRLKFGILLVAVVAVEGLIATVAAAFPFVAAAGFQTGLYATYVTGRTVTNIKAPQPAPVAVPGE